MASYTYGPYWAGNTYYRILFVENLFNTSTNTTHSIDAVLQIYHYDGSTSTYADPNSANISIKLNGSTLASGSYSSDIIYAPTGWMDIINGVSRSYTRGHSPTTYTVNVEASIRSGNTTYTRTINNISFTVPARSSYSVSYYKNDTTARPASGMPSSQTKWYDESLYLSSTTPTRQEYVFWHWNTSSNNSGTTYNKGAYYGSNASLSLFAIWNPIISYNANGGSGAPSQQTKTYGQTLKLSTATPQRTGYQFLGWNTLANGNGTNYSPGSNYTSNTPTTLYARWLKVADPPTISSMSVVRCDEEGVADDNGEYCVVRAKWSVDTTSAGMSSNTGVVTGTIVPESGSPRTNITFTSGASGTSGNAYALVPNCDTDTQYTVTVTVSNTVVGTGQSSILSTSRNDILTRAFFTLDFASGGKGIGVGTAAPQSGFEVGIESQFNDDVTFLGNIIHSDFELIHSISISEMIDTVTSAPGSITSVSGYRYGRLASVYVRFTLTSSLTLGQEFNVGQLKKGWRAIYSSPVCEEYGKAMGYTNSSGSIHLTALKAVSSGSAIHMSTTYMLG